MQQTHCFICHILFCRMMYYSSHTISKACNKHTVYFDTLKLVTCIVLPYQTGKAKDVYQTGLICYIRACNLYLTNYKQKVCDGYQTICHQQKPSKCNQLPKTTEKLTKYCLHHKNFICNLLLQQSDVIHCYKAVTVLYTIMTYLKFVT